MHVVLAGRGSRTRVPGWGRGGARVGCRSSGVNAPATRARAGRGAEVRSPPRFKTDPARPDWTTPSQPACLPAVHVGVNSKRLPPSASAVWTTAKTAAADASAAAALALSWGRRVHGPRMPGMPVRRPLTFSDLVWLLTVLRGCQCGAGRWAGPEMAR
eukprot:356600-Chlamydomonas_euryale.AAC.1